MNTLLSKDVRQLFLRITLATLIGIITFLLSTWYFGLMVSLSLFLLIIAKHEEKKRKQIESLTLYTKRLNHNDYNYELVSYEEGDWSILKSELHKTMYLLKSYNDELTSQKEFIYQSIFDISHQLKTPVAGILLMLDLMNTDQTLKPERIEHMTAQTERLESLIEHLLVHIQLEAQSISMYPLEVSAKQLILNVLDLITTDLEIEIVGDDFNISCDPKWTAEALFNVINNKLHIAQSKITISIYKNKLYKIIDISDDGPEIEEHLRLDLFKRFYKGEHSSPTSVGIGLAITKEIMELQGGKVRIADDNTFRFSFNDKSVTSL